MKVAYLVAFKDFRDEEYFIPKEILENEEVKVDTFSSEKGMALGSLGGEVEVSSISEINLSDYNAIIIAGGEGAIKDLDTGKVHEIVRAADKKKMIIGAICISPLILLHSGILKGIKATIWSSSFESEGVKEMIERGVNYDKSSVVVDKNIITASGPKASEKFGEKILSKIISVKPK